MFLILSVSISGSSREHHCAGSRKSPLADWYIDEKILLGERERERERERGTVHSTMVRREREKEEQWTAQ